MQAVPALRSRSGVHSTILLPPGVYKWKLVTVGISIAQPLKTGMVASYISLAVRCGVSVPNFTMIANNAILTKFSSLGASVPTPSPIRGEIGMKEWTHGVYHTIFHSRLCLLSPLQAKTSNVTILNFGGSCAHPLDQQGQIWLQGYPQCTFTCQITSRSVYSSVKLKGQKSNGCIFRFNNLWWGYLAAQRQSWTRVNNCNPSPIERCHNRFYVLSIECEVVSTSSRPGGQKSSNAENFLKSHNEYSELGELPVISLSHLGLQCDFYIECNHFRRSNAISVSVCLSTRMSQNSHVQISLNFMYM